VKPPLAAFRRARSVVPFAALLPTGLAALFAIGLAAVLSAPLRAAEVAVPLDPGGRIESIDPRLRRDLGLWPGLYPGFSQARLFQAPDSSFTLQVEFRRDGRMEQDRIPLGAAEEAELRARILDSLQERNPGALVDQSGRVVLLTASSLVGIGFYSWGVPYAMNLDGKDAVAAGMLAVAGSFAAPYFATKGAAVTGGMAHLAIYGGTRGIAHGILLRRLWIGPNDREESPVGAGVIASLVEGTAGYLWAQRQRLSPGRAHLIGVGGDLGLLWGVESAAWLGLGADDEGPDRGGKYTAVLGGAALGIAGGAILGRQRDPTYGDAEVLRAASVVGGGVAGAFWDAASDKRAQIAGAMLAGGIAGAAAGDFLTRREEFTPGQAVLIDLSTVTGATLALGVTYLASSTKTDKHEPFFVAGALGGTAGFAAGYAAFARNPFWRSGGSRFAGSGGTERTRSGAPRGHRLEWRIAPLLAARSASGGAAWSAPAASFARAHAAPLRAGANPRSTAPVFGILVSARW
jgi:hypothetical protein